jgi:hypothetical protein
MKKKGSNNGEHEGIIPAAVSISRHGGGNLEVIGCVK